MLILIQLKTVIILKFLDQYLLAGGFFLTKVDTAITGQWQKVRDKKGHILNSPCGELQDEYSYF